jgi:hypothetical protein
MNASPSYCCVCAQEQGDIAYILVLLSCGSRLRCYVCPRRCHDLVLPAHSSSCDMRFRGSQLHLRRQLAWQAAASNVQPVCAASKGCWQVMFASQLLQAFGLGCDNAVAVLCVSSFASRCAAWHRPATTTQICGCDAAIMSEVALERLIIVACLVKCRIRPCGWRCSQNSARRLSVCGVLNPWCNLVLQDVMYCVCAQQLRVVSDTRTVW